jgi:hypothetical protein
VKVLKLQEVSRRNQKFQVTKGSKGSNKLSTLD